ncbi:MAG: acetyl-CoA C-acyltransferase [Bacteroidetes bacterium QS_8_64_10]|nr:MAG: acetyl-CoA C-acyltransferase [Bacteroidetes bacterium QS_8_64_10]
MPDDLPPERTPVFVDGCRIPFLRSGTGYVDLKSYDLGRMALKGLLVRTGLPPEEADRVVMGTVVQNVQTSNVAREAALGAGFPTSVPAFTVTMACISSNQALASAADLIRTGQAGAVVASGTESLSDIPVQFKKKIRKKLFEARKYSSPGEYVKLLRDLRPSDLVPEIPSISEYSTGETMGESADKLAAKFDVSREAQDEYALRSHEKAVEAREAGHLQDEIVPAASPPDFGPITEDNGVRPDTSLEKLSKLSPSFVKPYGTVTAGNASFLTDGASASLVTSEAKANELDLKPQAVVRDYTFVAQNPKEELLLGPAYAMPQIMSRAGLSFADIDVIELHEAFAGQVLAVLRALEDSTFRSEKLNGTAPSDELPMGKLNSWGGSLSLGHPFGATGVRLVTTAAHRLRAEDARFALVAACAAGGQGHAMLLERHEGAS